MRGFLAHVAHQCSPCAAGQDLLVPREQQDPTHPGFVGVDRYYDCRRCVSWHADRFDFEPLETRNEPAWDLYTRLQDQQRVGMAGGMGLDYAVLPVAFDVYEVPPALRRELFEKLMVINRTVTQHEGQRRKEEARQREAETLRRAGRRRVDV